MMKKQVLKRTLAGVLCAAMAMTLFLFAGSAEVQAAGEDVRVYQQVSVDTCKEYMGKKEAPIKEGYLFAGWIATVGETETAVTGVDDEALTQSGVTVKAKFIPQQLAGVACQIKANAYDEGVNSTELRIVSLADDGKYQAFGFNLYRRQWSIANQVYVEDTLCQYSATSKNPAETTDRYSGMYGQDNALKTPVDLFGAKAEGFYFTTVRIGGIPKAVDQNSVYDTCVFAIQPYWITADGTYVEGLMEYDRVSDGNKGIVNISVNIKQAAAIAAGALNVEYDDSKFTFDSADFGRVFQEMKVDSNTTGVVKCVGNVADITNNATDPNDIYINLRFTRKAGAAIIAGNSTFRVTDTDFCDKDEKNTAYTIGNVIY